MRAAPRNDEYVTLPDGVFDAVYNMAPFARIGDDEFGEVVAMDREGGAILDVDDAQRYIEASEELAAGIEGSGRYIQPHVRIVL